MINYILLLSVHFAAGWADCNKLTFTHGSAEFVVTDNSHVTVHWFHGRPDAQGKIDRSLNPPSGSVNFPDDRVYNFWVREDEGKIYWDVDQGGHFWTINGKKDCENEDVLSGCDKLFYNGITFSMESNRAAVYWGHYGRPDAFGEIDRTVYPPTGYINFPDDRVYKFWVREAEDRIYWDADQGGHFWPIDGKEGCSKTQCSDELGKEYSEGESYVDDDGKTCNCESSGSFACACGQDVACDGGTESWTNEETCETQCISSPGYCSSSGDPHYRTFDGTYYDFHGTCTYQAASCDNFVVNFKNVDFYNRAPRYTKRAELVFKGRTFAVAAGYSASVDGEAVQVPYVKTYTNGDTVSIVNNGQLEIILNQKNRSPAVRIRGNNAGSYIDAEVWLHGSCASETEGLCGSYNGNSGDDLTGGSANTLGTLFEHYDEDCPAPPDPYHPCDDVPDGYAMAEAICKDLKGAPFESCHSTLSIGNSDGGIYSNCMTDVCNCWGDASCACSQYDNFASTCIDAGIDLANWRESVSYCPYECPAGLKYASAAPTPAATCLNKNPEKTGTARGCFCPDGEYLQDGVCVKSEECKCLYEGAFYENGDEVVEEGSCKLCTCGDAGEMNCSEMTCPALDCTGETIKASDPEKCCSFCSGDWVRAVGSANVSVAYGQSASFTVEILTNGVKKKDKIWTKGGESVKGATKNRLSLKKKNLKVEDSGTYEFTASKGGSSKTVVFNLQVLIPQEPQFKVTAAKTEVTCNPKKPKNTCRLYFDIESLEGKEVNSNNGKICQWVEGEAIECVKATYINKQFRKVRSEPATYVFVYTDQGKNYVSDAVTVATI